MAARAVPGPEVGAILRHHLRLDAGLGQGCPQRLRDRRKRRRGERVEAHREAVAVAGLRQQRFRLLRVEAVRRRRPGCPQAARPECLVHGELAGEKGIGHAVVVDGVAQRPHHLLLAEDRMRGVRRQIDHRALRMAIDREVGVAGQARDQVGREVTRQVDRARLQQPPLGVRLRHVAQDDALHSRRAGVVVGIGGQNHRLPRLPPLQPKRTGAGAVGQQPARAEVALLLLRQRELPVHDRSQAGGEHVQHQPGRELLDDGQADVTVIDHLDQLADVVRVPAELSEEGGRRPVAPDHPLQGKLDVLGAHRVAGVEPEAVANPQRDRLAVAAHRMALGDAAGQRARVLRLERHDPIVEVGDDLAGGELERLRRIQGDEVGDVLRDYQGVRVGLGRGRRGGHGDDAEQGDERPREPF